MEAKAPKHTAVVPPWRQHPHLQHPLWAVGQRQEEELRQNAVYQAFFIPVHVEGTKSGPKPKTPRQAQQAIEEHEQHVGESVAVDCLSRAGSALRK